MNYFTKIKNNLIDAVKKTFVYKGRATREQYWHFALSCIAVSGFMLFLAGFIYFLYSFTDSGFKSVLLISISILLILYFIFRVLIFFPRLSLGFRRMHDIGKSGFWYLSADITMRFVVDAVIYVFYMVFFLILYFLLDEPDFDSLGEDETTSLMIGIIFLSLGLMKFLAKLVLLIVQTFLCCIKSQPGLNKYDFEAGADAAIEIVQNQNKNLSGQ